MESVLSENGRGEWDYTQLRRRGSRGTGIKKWGVWLHCTPERTACQPENLGNRREKPGKSADLSGPPHHVLVGAQLRKAHEKGLLRNRVQILPGLGCCDLNQFTSHASGTPLTADRKISLGAVKHLVDGSLQCYTGCLSNPYHKIIYDLPDGPMWRGYIQENPEGFIDRIVALHLFGELVDEMEQLV